MAKNKPKPRKAAVKRYKVTGSGKIMRGRVGAAHLLTKKSRRRKRAMNVATEVHPADRQNIARLIRP